MGYNRYSREANSSGNIIMNSSLEKKIEELEKVNIHMNGSLKCCRVVLFFLKNKIHPRDQWLSNAWRIFWVTSVPVQHSSANAVTMKVKEQMLP